MAEGAPGILGCRDDLHVPRIHARRLPAEVINGHLRGDGFAKLLIRDPMCGVLARATAGSIAFPIERIAPDPARGNEATILDVVVARQDFGAMPALSLMTSDVPLALADDQSFRGVVLANGVRESPAPASTKSHRGLNDVAPRVADDVAHWLTFYVTIFGVRTRGDRSRRPAPALTEAGWISRRHSYERPIPVHVVPDVSLRLALHVTAISSGLCREWSRKTAAAFAELRSRIVRHIASLVEVVSGTRSVSLRVPTILLSAAVE